MPVKRRLNQVVDVFKRRFRDKPARALNAVQPAETLKAAVAEEVGAYRERVYPPVTTIDAGPTDCLTNSPRRQ